VGGFTGAILTRSLRDSAVNTVFKDEAGNALPSGLLEGNPKQVLNQLIAGGHRDRARNGCLTGDTEGGRSSGGGSGEWRNETLGLDLSQHGEEGYNLDFDYVATSTLALPAGCAKWSERSGQYRPRVGMRAGISQIRLSN
jgi:hypothetical protein